MDPGPNVWSATPDVHLGQEFLGPVQRAAPGSGGEQQQGSREGGAGGHRGGIA